ncbi:MAG TPA: DUF3052 family protein [Longimicrobiales bacterium]|nr:DUF3052 family protein [Longimicrobiales bacterium]
MGKEAHCIAHYQGQSSSGTLQLETDDVRFKGDFRLKIPLKTIQQAVAQDGALRVRWPDGEARFELGAAAAKWAEQITNPKSLLDKLGVKPGLSVAVVGITDEEFLSDLHERVSGVRGGAPARGTDLVFFQADLPKQLDALKKLKAAINSDGVIWVVTPKKRPEIADTVVMAAGKSAGLVDVKVVRFSETHSALKFVIPRNQR